MLKYILGAAIAAALAASPAFAAKISFDPTDCKGNGTKCGLIIVEGEIRDGDQTTFANVSKGVDRALIVLNTQGGDFKAGLNIARQIKTAGWNTGVHNYCVSVCAVMWLSGSDRYYRVSSRIGFHGIYWTTVDRNGNTIKGSARVSSGGNAVLGGYLAELGLSETTIDLLASPGPTEMYWLQTKNLKQLCIKAERLDD